MKLIYFLCFIIFFLVPVFAEIKEDEKMSDVQKRAIKWCSEYRKYGINNRSKEEKEEEDEIIKSLQDDVKKAFKGDLASMESLGFCFANIDEKADETAYIWSSVEAHFNLRAGMRPRGDNCARTYLFTIRRKIYHCPDNEEKFTDKLDELDRIAHTIIIEIESNISRK
jgi:hypothetical protein